MSTHIVKQKDEKCIQGGAIFPTPEYQSKFLTRNEYSQGGATFPTPEIYSCSQNGNKIASQTTSLIKAMSSTLQEPIKLSSVHERGLPFADVYQNGTKSKCQKGNNVKTKEDNILEVGDLTPYKGCEYTYTSEMAAVETNQGDRKLQAIILKKILHELIEEGEYIRAIDYPSERERINGPKRRTNIWDRFVFQALFPNAVPVEESGMEIYEISDDDDL